MKPALDLLTVSVADRAEVNARFVAAMRGEVQGNFVSFTSIEQYWRTLAPKRMQIVNAMKGAGPLAIREVARRVGRDAKAVHGDVQLLLTGGIIEKTDDGKILFPYDAIHVDFMLTNDAA